MKTFTNFKELYERCQEFGFNPEITAQQCWNEGYQLGRRRWYWGPMWSTDLKARLGSWRARRKAK